MCVDSAGGQEVERQTAGRGLKKIGCEQRGARHPHPPGMWEAGRAQAGRRPPLVAGLRGGERLAQAPHGGFDSLNVHKSAFDREERDTSG